MVTEKSVESGGLEWRVTVSGDSSSMQLVPESGRRVSRAWLGFLGLVLGLKLKVFKVFEKLWRLGADDPRKVMHGLKVGIALTVVSLFYYMRPLYDGVGGNAMWAVMTVVVVFEFFVGATLGKGLNRAIGTMLAGFLAVGIHLVANKFNDKGQPIILGTSLFFLASVATFSRFLPTIKTRYDYGVMIFILTFSLVSVSSYRVEKLLDLAYKRLTTIAIGSSMCVLISILVCPVWAGQDLHLLIARNIEKLADSINGCVVEYFKDNDDNSDDEEPSPQMQGYKCILNSKATEESLANFASWEPAHGSFGFRHPWKQYLKIGTMCRYCAYCVEALNGCINSEIQAPDLIRKHLSTLCMILSSHSSNVLKELSINIKTMTKPSNIDFFVGEMKSTVEQLHDSFEILPHQLITATATTTTTAAEATGEERRHRLVLSNSVPLMEVLPLVTVMSLLIEIATRIEGVVDAVEELSTLADFKPAIIDKPNQQQQQQQQQQQVTKPIPDQQGQESMETLQLV